MTEAQNEAEEDFGEARLCDIVRSFAGTAPQFDDITVLVLKKL